MTANPYTDQDERTDNGGRTLEAPDRTPRRLAGRGWRRGGRWDRILATLYRQDLEEPAIRFATQTGEHPRRVECKKVKRALADMARLGLIRRTGRLYEITALGTRALTGGGLTQPASVPANAPAPHKDPTR